MTMRGWENYLVRLGIDALDATMRESTPTSRVRFENHLRERMQNAAKVIHMEVEKKSEPVRDMQVEVMIRDLLSEVPVGRRPEALRKIEGMCRAVRQVADTGLLARNEAVQEFIQRIDAAVVRHSGDEGRYEPSIKWLAGYVEKLCEESAALRSVAEGRSPDPEMAADLDVTRRNAEVAEKAADDAEAKLKRVLDAWSRVDVGDLASGIYAAAGSGDEGRERYKAAALAIDEMNEIVAKLAEGK